MKITVFLIALLIFGIFSSQEWKEVTIGSPFKISYPTNYVKTYDLNADASLQIMNAIKEKYTIIIQDDREALKDLKLEFTDSEEALAYYAKNIIEGLKDNDKKKASKIKNFKIGDYNASEMAIEGQTSDDETGELMNIFYFYTVIKTPNNYYQILSWSKLEDRQKYEDEFRDIAKSFKELNVN